MPTLLGRNFSLRTLVYSIAVICLCGILLLYVVFQARHVLQGPIITLIDEPAHLTTAPTITLSGTTENIVSLTLNGKSIYTNDAGAFTETLVLPYGYTIMTLTAKDRYGRVRSLERTYVRKITTNV